jgi:mevalonate kinase
MITTSAPGKLMLMGEHAVLYGSPCLVSAISQRLTVSIEETGERLEIIAPQAANTSFVEEAIAVAKKTWSLSPKGLRVTTKSAFSGTYGFGSSAAVTVGTLAAMAALFGKSPTHDELFSLGRKVVGEVQGAGSGFDIASAVWGGTLWFVRQGEVIEDLPDFRDCMLIVGYSGSKADTKSMIADVAKKRASDPQKVNRIFSAIEKLVVQAKDAYVAGDWPRLGTYMNFNQEYLRDLGVSTEKLEALIAAAKKAGAWGAKLSGAGGGDCMIAISSNDTKEAVQNALIAAGGEVVLVAPHAPGVRIEPS